MSSVSVLEVAVAIVGAGPAGLSAAAMLASQVDGRVLVIEREAEPGGIPRHSDHLGYGVRDLHRFLSGPEYARRLTGLAVEAGAEIETHTMVTGWKGPRGDHGPQGLEVTGPAGRRTVYAKAVVLATGARERPRAARLIAGDRVAGVYTTGQLQNAVYLYDQPVGERAVVVGAEAVSWSAVMTLRGADCKVAAMVTEYPWSETYAAFRLVGRALWRTPVVTNSRVIRIFGRGRVQGVEIEHCLSAEREVVECDTVVLTADWIPDHELARLGGVPIDVSTLGPVVDASLSTEMPGVFAIGNLIHPVDTADCAALDGQHVTAAVLQWLALGGDGVSRPTIELRTEAPLRWVSPQRIRPGLAAPRGHLVLWADEYRRLPLIVANQDGRKIGEVRTVWPAAPGRILRVPERVISDAEIQAGPVTLSLG